MNNTQQILPIAQIAQKNLGNRRPIFEGAARLKIVLCLLTLLGWLLPLPAALAHGGGTLQVANYSLDAYRVSVWTNPPTVRAGQTIHVTVGLAAADSGEPVLDAAVLVQVLDDGEPVATATASTEQSANRLFYEADLAPLGPGSYGVVVQVSGSEGGGELSFPLEVGSVSLWPWVGGILAGAGILGVVLRYWRRGSDGGSVKPRR